MPFFHNDDIKLERREKLEEKIIYKTVSIFLVLLLLVFAFELVKTSLANSLGEFIKRFAENELMIPHRAFCWAWISGLIAMTSAPISALGLTFTAAGMISIKSLFFILLGSHASPDIILFIIGLIALFKGNSLYRSFGLGVIEFLTTLSVTTGVIILNNFSFIHTVSQTISKHLHSLSFHRGFVEYYIAPLVLFSIDHLGTVITFLIGVTCIFFSIKYIDKLFAVLEFEKKNDKIIRLNFQEQIFNFIKHPFSKIGNFLKQTPGLIKKIFAPTFTQKFQKNFKKFILHPIPSFFLGLIITTLTMSNAISITMIVPFYIYKVIDIRTLIPYILGSTLSSNLDTFFLALLTGNPGNIEVLTQVAVSSVICVLAYMILFRPYVYIMSFLTHHILRKKWIFISFLCGICLIPIIFVLL